MDKSLLLLVILQAASWALIAIVADRDTRQNRK
jgi:hypothetical protein